MFSKSFLNCLKTNQILLKGKQLIRLSSDSPQLVTVEKRENVTLIGINRPQTRNCVNRETAQFLNKAFTDFEADDTSPVAILYGNGGTFCAGYDLKELSTFDDNISDESIIRGPMV